MDNILIAQLHMGIYFDELDTDFIGFAEEDIIDYINPVGFENKIRQFEPKLWPVEFKKSINVIFSLLGENKFMADEANRNLFEDLLVFHEKLANLYLGDADFANYRAYCHECQRTHSIKIKAYFNTTKLY